MKYFTTASIKTKMKGLMILLFFCAFVFENASSALALSCGDPDSCVIIVDYWGVRNFTSPMYVSFNDPAGGIDTSCSPISSRFLGNRYVYQFYDHEIYKYYWTGSYWNVLTAQGFNTESAKSPPGVTQSVTAGGPPVYLPNDCSGVVDPNKNLSPPQCK